MNVWEWNTKLEVGIEEIDNQHKELFNRVNRLVKSVNMGDRHSEISETIDYLIQYVKEHFESEEKIQEYNNYPHYLFHKSLHTEFVNSIYEMKESLEENGVSPELSLELCQTVNSWLIEHIGIADKVFADYIKTDNNE